MNTFTRQMLVGACAVLCSASLAAKPVADRFMPLPAGAVHLGGEFEKDIQNSITHWNKGVVPYHKFVEFFRTGRPQFALGEMWGKGVRSGCMFYRYTHDAELKAIMKATVDDMLSAQRSNGSFSCDDVNLQPGGTDGDLWERKYVLLGLDEYYRQVEADPRVLKAMTDQADCIIAQIGPAPKVEITSLGWSSNHIESCTLLEPFMRLYNLTGQKKYLDFADYIVKSGGSMGYNIFQQAYDNVPPYQMGGPYPKAYEMMSMFEGLVEYYRATGDEHWKTCFMNLYRNICKHEITLIGNGGGDQPYHPAVCGEGWDNTALEQTNPDITRMMETCVGVTWMKLCSQILRLTGDASTVDEIEKYVYNGLLGAMKPSGDGFSYVNLLNGEKVTNLGWGWKFDSLPVTCCNLNGPMGLAYLPYIAVMNTADGPVVNLYNAGEATATTRSGGLVKLRIVGDYPLSGNVKIEVEPSTDEQFTVQLRIPSWSAHNIVRINGRKLDGAVAGAYMAIKRTWRSGDVIDLGFEMKAHLIDAPKGSNRAGDRFQALKWGPIVLARDENTDSNYNQPVQVKADKRGIVKVKRVAPTLSGTRIEFEVPTTDGTIRMIDYASVNGWEGKRICTWMPMK